MNLFNTKTKRYIVLAVLVIAVVIAAFLLLQPKEAAVTPTVVPTTEAPATDAPVTDVPVTDVPVTDAPVTDVPVTKVPETATSVTLAPPAENLFLTNPILDMFGEDFDLSKLEGKVLMLNFWATWCPPCVGEMPELSELAVEYADKIALLGILSSGVKDVDKDGKVIADENELKLAKEYYEKAGISYPSLIPNMLLIAVQQQLQMQSIPTTLFVNPEGIIVEMIVGARDKAGWVQIINRVLETVEKVEE